MTKLEKILECLEEMSDGELVSIWDNFCDETNRFDDYIEYTGDIDSLFEGAGVQKILEIFGNRDFSMADDYYWIDGYGEAVSSNDPLDGPIDLHELAEYIVESGDPMYNDDIRDILTEEEGTEETEETEMPA